jgi:Uncharacterized conserved protein
MAIWGVRAGRHGEQESYAIEQNCAVAGWTELNSDLDGFQSRDSLLGLLREIYPEKETGTLTNWVNQLWAFSKRIETGDIVALPRKLTSTIAFGRVTGKYRFASDASPGFQHQIPVEWINKDFQRSQVEMDLLHSLGSSMTVFQVSRNNAEERIRDMLAGKPSPKLKELDATKAEISVEGSESLNIEEVASYEIINRIGARFRRHEMEELVEAVLKAQGFETQRTPPGPDGGVDIVAGKGALGLEPPKICVQVKSSDEPQGVSVLRQLQGAMSTFGGDIGLIVAWGGFTPALQQEARRQFFKIRLWDQDALLNAIFENYDQLPERIQKDLPLKRVWVLVKDDD